MFLCLLLAALTTSVASSEESTTLEEADYHINKAFLLTQEGIDVENVIEGSSRMFIKRRATQVGKQTLPSKSRKRIPSWLLAWFRRHEQEHEKMLMDGEVKHACIIPNLKRRKACCSKKVKSSNLKKRPGFKYWRPEMVSRCLRLVRKHYENLKENSLILTSCAEKILELELEGIVQKQNEQNDDDNNINSKYRMSSRFEAVFAGNESVANNSARIKRRTGYNAIRTYREGESLAAFLMEMKRIEIISNMEMNSNSNSQSTTQRAIRGKIVANRNQVFDEEPQEEQQRVFSKFISAFQEQYQQNLTGEFYHGVEEEWMTCSAVIAPNNASAMYCAYLKTIDPDAMQLGREPIFGWEAGRQAHLAKEENEDSMESVERKVKEEEVKEEEVEEKKVNGNGSRQAVQVNLFGSRSACSSADIAYGCFAMCCDSVNAYSFFCMTYNLECIC